MKRICFTIVALLLGVCLFLPAYTISANAQEQKYNILFPNDQEQYIELDSPEMIAVRGNEIAILDTSIIRIIGATIESISIDYRVTAMGFSHDYLVVNNYDDDQLNFYNLKTGTMISQKIVCDTLTIVNNQLYYTKYRQLFTVDITENLILSDEVLVVEDKHIKDTSQIFVSSNEIYLAIRDELYKINGDLVENTGISYHEVTMSGDNIFTLDSGVIKYYNTMDEMSLVFDNVVSDDILNMYASNNDLYIIYTNKCGIYKYNLIDDELLFAGEYSSYGSSEHKLHNPLGIESYGDFLYVADNNNNRISKINPATKQVEIILAGAVLNPEKLAINSEYIAILEENGNIKIFNHNYELIDTRGFGRVKDISTNHHTNEIYILSDTNLYLYDNGSFVLGKDTVGMEVFDYSTNGKYSYYAENNQIVATIDDSAYNIGIVEDFVIDYVGNVVTFLDNSITVYIRQADSLEQGATVVLPTNISGIAIANGGDIFATGIDHRIYRIDSQILSTVSEDTFIPEPVKDLDIGDEPFSRANIYKVSNKTALMTYTNNFEAITMAYKDDIAIAYTGVIKGLIYVQVNNSFGYIREQDLLLVEDSAPTNPYIQAFINNVKLYKYPYIEAKVLNTVVKGYDLKIVSTLLDFTITEGDSKYAWVAVEYDKGVAYVLYHNVIESKEPIVIPKVPVYMKVKSHKIGAMVPIYDQRNILSARLIDLADGTKIEIVEDEDNIDSDMYKIRFIQEEQEIIGYILKTDVTESSLTTSQQVAIIVVVVTVLATITIGAITYYIKKTR